jgi:WD40 repeat protein
MSTNGDNSLRIWSLTREEEKYHVSHTDEITCFVITADSLHVITGSRDMSLKVWQATGGKLAQVSSPCSSLNSVKIAINVHFAGVGRTFGCRFDGRCFGHQ